MALTSRPLKADALGVAPHRSLEQIAGRHALLVPPGKPGLMIVADASEGLLLETRNDCARLISCCRSA